jgi:pheromone a factor receptor
MLVAILPLQAYIVYADIHLSFPWHAYSWSNLHSGNWNTIHRVPTKGVVFFDRWTPVASGFMIFIFFGFGRDASHMYRTACWYLGLGLCFPSITAPDDSSLDINDPRRDDQLQGTMALLQA